jgi:hypothetical protein
MGYDAERHKRQSEAIKQDYLASGVLKNKNEYSDLHMFFSPWQVPAGLTDAEIRICLDIHKVREKLGKQLIHKRKNELQSRIQKRLENDFEELEKERLALSVLWGEKIFKKSAEEIAKFIVAVDILEYIPIPLPLELRQNPMTRKSFELGIQKLQAQIKKTII